MKRRLLLTIVLALAVGVGACGDDDDPAANNGNNNSNGTADGGDAGDAGTDATDADDGGDDADDGGNDADDGGNDAADGDDDAEDGTPTGLHVSADDQLLAAASSNTVTVSSARSEGPGWVIIHEGDGDGNVGAQIGRTSIEDGESTDIEVEVDRNLTHGEMLYAMLYIDSGTVGSFDEGEDVNATDDSDANISDTFTVSVPTVVAYEDTTLDDLSTVLTLNTVVAEADAFVVIHENDCTDFGAVIGHAAVTSGENSDVEVTLERPAVDGESLCGMLHFDTGEAGTYEFGTVDGEDGPVTLADGSVVMTSFDVALGSDAELGLVPAVRITIGATGSQDYEFQSVEPAAFDDGLSSTSDPVLFLQDGWRYEIVNNATAAHPFEFVAQETGVGGAGDYVVLSQESDPAEEADADTAWAEDGDNFRFTVAGDAFEGASTGVTTSQGGVETYQCAMHPASMTNTVTVQ